MASQAIEQLRAERAAQRATSGYKPVQYTPPSQNPKYFGVEVTPEGDDKSFGQKVLQDTALLAYGVPTAIAKIGTGLFTNPVATVKEVGGALKQTAKDIIGTTGLLGEETQKESLDYYKAHPVMALLDVWGVATLGTGAVVKSGLTSTARSAMSTAVKAGVKEGVKESVIRSAMITARSIINPKRLLGGGKTRFTSNLMESINAVSRTGKVDKVVTTMSTALVKNGVSPEVAVRIAQETAKEAAISVAKQSGKLKIFDNITHPIGASVRGLKAPVGRVTTAVLGAPETTAVGKLFGADVVKVNKKSALGLERWLEAVVNERGLTNTTETRLRVLMEWKKSSEFAGMTTEQLFRDFDNYVKADVNLRNLRELTGNNFVAVKALSKETADSMADTMSSNAKRIKDEVSETPGMTAERVVDSTFDKISTFMEENFGRDWEKFAPSLRKSFGKGGSLPNLKKAIANLSSRKPTVSFAKWTAGAKALAKEMEGTGYRVSNPPTKKVVSQVADVTGEILEVGAKAKKVTTEIAESAVDTERTFLGKVLENFGFSTRGIVEGTNEFVFRQSWIQHAMVDIGKKFGGVIKIKKPIVVTTTRGKIGNFQKISIPVDKLYEWIYKNRTEIFETRGGAGRFGAFRPVNLFDVTTKDLIKIGFDEKVAKAITKVSKKSLRKVPTSVIGIGEKLVNLVRTSDVGFAKFGTFYDTFLKTAFYMRYQSGLSVMFQAQQFLETKMMAAMLTRSAKLLPGAEGLAGFGERMIPKKVTGILANTKTYLQKITKDPELVELAIARDELLPNVRRALEDTMGSPEFARIRVGLEGVAKKTESGASVLSRQKLEAFWMQMFGGWSQGMAAKTGKAISNKFGLTLEQATEYTMREGKKIYTHPKLVQTMQDAVQQTLHYKVGFQTSPLAKTLNIIWFPFRFQAKTVEVTAKWMGSISPTSRAVIINNWVNFANWTGTDEGIEWRKTHQNLLYSILAYTTAWEQMGDAVDSVARGRLFGGQTGLIGGVPFGFIYNTAQELAILPDDPDQVDPATGRLFRFKEVPRDLVSEASFLVALEEFMFMMVPGMPLYTVSGGVIKGASYRNFMESIIESGWGWSSATIKGEDPKRAQQMLMRDFMRVKYGETR